MVSCVGGGGHIKLGWLGWLLSITVGVVVFVLWINLTEPWMIIGTPTASFQPVDDEGQLMWSLVLIRWVGAALMVPVMEELFWRSFLMRWIDNPDFEAVSPKAVTVKAIALSTFAFRSDRRVTRCSIPAFAHCRFRRLRMDSWLIGRFITSLDQGKSGPLVRYPARGMVAAVSGAEKRHSGSRYDTPGV